MKPRIKLPEKLIPVFQGKADVRGAYGGRGSGKTRSFAIMAAVQSLRFAQANIRGTVLCVREWMNSLSDSSFEEIKTAILEHDELKQFFIVGETYIKTSCGNVYFTFAGLNRNISSIKSKARILLCWADEAEPIKESAWTVLDNTIREDHAELWVTWNPEIKGSATDLRFRQSQDPNYNVIELNYTDNQFFPERLERNRQRDLIQRPEEYDWIWHGGYRTHVSGAVWGRELSEAKNSGRITLVPHQEGIPVYTAWDLGRRDATAVWFWQQIGREVHVIDYLCDSFKDPDWFAGQLLGKNTVININHDKLEVVYGDEIEEAKHRQKYDYHALWLPHDAKAKTFAAKGKSTEELLASVFGWSLIQRVPNLSRQDGIQAARKIIKHCYWDESTRDGFDMLCAYQFEFKEDRGIFSDTPLHNYASNPADAFRYLAICAQEPAPKINKNKEPHNSIKQPIMKLLQDHIENRRNRDD